MRSRLLALAGALLMVVGLVVLVRADDGLLRERSVVQGVPVTLLRPPGPGPFPGVVVAHGFSGSGRLMDGIAIAFARDGWAVALPDLPGHGANRSGLEDADLAREVIAVAEWLQGRDDVSDLALLGHSMGAGAVTEAAASRPELPVVALSLPSADDLSADLDALLLVGSAERESFGDAAAQAAAMGYATETVAGAEHISILFRTQTLRTSVGWLDDRFGRAGAPVSADWRMLAVAACYLGSALLFWPLSAWVVRSRRDVVTGRAPRVPRWLALPAAALLAGGVLAVLPGLAELAPLLVGGYLAVFVGLTGLLVWAVGRRRERLSPASVGQGLALGIYAAAAIAVPAQLGWAQVSLVGARGAAAGALLAAFVLFSWAELSLNDRVGYLSVVGGRLLVTLVLALLALTGAAPGFLLLLLPLVAVLLPWFGSYGARVTRLSGSPLAGALSQAPALALLVAITTPLA